MNRTLNLIIGGLLAILCCGILIYAYETNRSFAQILITFGILILPISFISSIRSKVAIFLFVSILILGGYICIRQQWFDTGFGLVLALLLGGAIYFLRISKASTFDAAGYKNHQKSQRNG